MIEPIRLTFQVRVGPDVAFDVWTSRIGAWWPPDHTVTGAVDVEVGLEGESWRDRNHGGWSTLLPHYLSATELAAKEDGAVA